jgi:hypothetical protein
MIFTLGVGDIDYDGENEIVTEVGYFELKVFQWNGTHYILEWSRPFQEDAHNEAMDINHIDSNNKEIIAIGIFELYVIGHDTDYVTIFESDTYTVNAQCLLMGDLDESGTNEIYVSIGSYIFIYGTDPWLLASLKASKTKVVVDEQVVFDGSFSKGPGILEYYFNYGDGADSGWTYDSITSHSYSDAGTYTVSLTIRDEFGNESTNTAEVTISVLEHNIPPTAFIDYISPESPIEGNTVTFSGHGEDEDGTITSYLWTSDIDGDLGDSNSFSISTLSVGTHSIFFKVKDDRDTWSDYDNETLVVEPKAPDQNQVPRAYIDKISPSRGTEGETITFEGHGIDDDGTIISYLWESDIDGILSDVDTFSSSTLSAGTHSITFKVKDDGDSWSEPDFASLTIDPIIQNEAPTASIDFVAPNPAPQGETITFEGHGVDSDGSIISYSWESDIDGILSSERTFSTSSLSIGEHVITFKVQDDKEVWSEPEILTLVVNEKGGGGSSGSSESDDVTHTVIFLGILTFAIVFTIFLVVAISKKKSESSLGVTSCPNCSSYFRVTSPVRPLAVQCPICDQNTVLYE